MAKFRYRVTAILVARKESHVRTVDHVMRLDHTEETTDAKARINRAYPKDDIQHIEFECLDRWERAALIASGAP